MLCAPARIDPPKEREVLSQLSSARIQGRLLWNGLLIRSSRCDDITDILRVCACAWAFISVPVPVLVPAWQLEDMEERVAAAEHQEQAARVELEGLLSAHDQLQGKWREASMEVALQSQRCIEVRSRASLRVCVCTRLHAGR